MKINRDKNVEYYSKDNKYSCSCDPCKNYVVSIKSSYPEFHTYLQKMGIDATKPFETMWYENRRDETIEYLAQYIVFGECNIKYEEFLDEKIQVYLTTTHPGFDSDDKWFVIGASIISLKWNLEISFDEAFKITRNITKKCSRRLQKNHQ